MKTELDKKSANMWVGMMLYVDHRFQTFINAVLNISI